MWQRIIALGCALYNHKAPKIVAHRGLWVIKARSIGYFLNLTKRACSQSSQEGYFTLHRALKLSPYDVIQRLYLKQILSKIRKHLATKKPPQLPSLASLL